MDAWANYCEPKGGNVIAMRGKGASRKRLAIPQASSFEKRWPVALPPAMSLQLFQAARKASQRPTFCMYVHYGSACWIG
jgi:hypothetical protein